MVTRSLAAVRVMIGSEHSKFPVGARSEPAMMARRVFGPALVGSPSTSTY